MVVVFGPVRWIGSARFRHALSVGEALAANTRVHRAVNIPIRVTMKSLNPWQTQKASSNLVSKSKTRLSKEWSPLIRFRHEDSRLTKSLEQVLGNCTFAKLQVKELNTLGRKPEEHVRVLLSYYSSP